jgi:hypothetical protein
MTFQGSMPCVGMRFCGHVPNSLRNKNPKRHISYLLGKVDFLDPKRLLSPFGRGKKKSLSSTLNVMILQMVRNDTVRFGRHIDIEVGYKILQLEIPKLVLILHYSVAFKRGCLEAILSKNTFGPLGVNCRILLWTINIVRGKLFKKIDHMDYRITVFEVKK